jgi:DHA1 family tetracycline resistance protein-like MFS transporter
LAASNPPGKHALAVIFITVFLDLLGIGLLVPVAPFVVRQFREDGLTVGLLALSFSLFQFLASPVLGVVSDRHGRRPVLLGSIFGTGVGYVLFGWAGALWILFLSRIIDGITGGNISTAQAYIADISPPEERAKNFGLIGAAFGLGFIVGPALGGILSKISLSAPAYAAASLSFATTVYAYFALPESLPPDKRRARALAVAELNPLRQVKAWYWRPALTPLFTASLLTNLAMAGLQTNFAVYTADRFRLGPDANAAIFAAIGTVSALTQGVLMRRWSARFDAVRLLVGGLLLCAAGFAGIAAAPVWWALYPACMAIAFGLGVSNPSLVGLLSRRVEASDQGVVLGVTQSLASISRAAGPVFAGAIYDGLGRSAPYWAGALFLLAAWTCISRASSAASTPSSRAVSSSP